MKTLYETLHDLGLKYYTVKAKDGVLFFQASTHKDIFDNPITEVWHKVATSIAFRVHIKEKKLHIQRTNSRQKGMGTKMVDVVAGHFLGYNFSVVDQSRRKGDTGPTFWDKMTLRHPKLSVTKPNNVPLPPLNLALSLKLSSIIRTPPIRKRW